MNQPGLNIAQERAYPTPYAASPLLPLLLLSLATQKHSPKIKTRFDDEYDYVVVGAGSAGAAVASRLSEKFCVTVLLLEAGKPPPRLTEIPAIPRCYVNTDIDWQFFTAPQNHTGAGIVDRKLPWPSGKTLGGSSILNAMLYVRGNRKNYDQWAEMGAEGWSYEEVLPYFKKLEDNRDPEYISDANGRYHAAGGPITASRPNYNPEKKQALMEAIKNENYSFVNSNAEKQNGFFDYQASIRNGQRSSTAKGYLVPADHRDNLDIVPNAFVRKVVIENNRTVGVEFDFRGSTRRVNVKREVILSAGTTNTAQLLMLSGIGPASELQKFEIPVIADLPVGLNMQDHQATVLSFEVEDRIPKFDAEVRKRKNILDYITARKGPLTSAEGFILMSFLNNEGNGMEGDPDHSVYFADFLDIQLAQGGYRQELVDALFVPFANKSLITCAVQILNPKSRGTVTLQSADPYDPPVIDPNYFENETDIVDMVKGMKVCMRIMDNPAMKKIGAKPLAAVVPGCEESAADVDKYFECILRTIIFTTSHQVGTAKMGDPKDPTTVVDPELRVKGIEGLRVVDASIMPTVPWSNTNIPTIMVAEKASDIIKKDIQCTRIKVLKPESLKENA